MPHSKKAVFVILDGVSDRPSETLSGATPLQAAATPNMNRLVEQGSCCLMDPLFPGVTVGTHTGTALLMGLPRQQVGRLSRGPVEAAGVGVPIYPGDVALRCNFSTLHRNGEVLEIKDRRAGRIRHGTDELAALLQDFDLGDGVSASLYPATQHRAMLRLSGNSLSAAISDTDPGGGWKATGLGVCTTQCWGLVCRAHRKRTQSIYSNRPRAVAGC